MNGSEYYRDSIRSRCSSTFKENILESVGDIYGQILLLDQGSRGPTNQARNLAETEDLTVRDVSDIRLAEDQGEMMRAERIEVNRLDDDQFVVLGGERTQERLLGRVSTEQRFDQVGKPTWRVFCFWIFRVMRNVQDVPSGFSNRVCQRVHVLSFRALYGDLVVVCTNDFWVL